MENYAEENANANPWLVSNQKHFVTPQSSSFRSRINNEASNSLRLMKMLMKFVLDFSFVSSCNLHLFEALSVAKEKVLLQANVLSFVCFRIYWFSCTAQIQQGWV